MSLVSANICVLVQNEKIDSRAKWPPPLGAKPQCMWAFYPTVLLDSFLLQAPYHWDTECQGLSQYKDCFSKYGDFHVKDKTVVRLSYV